MNSTYNYWFDKSLDWDMDADSDGIWYVPGDVNGKELSALLLLMGCEADYRDIEEAERNNGVIPSTYRNPEIRLPKWFREDEADKLCDGIATPCARDALIMNMYTVRNYEPGHVRGARNGVSITMQAYLTRLGDNNIIVDRDTVLFILEHPHLLSKVHPQHSKEVNNGKSRYPVK